MRSSLASGLLVLALLTTSACGGDDGAGPKLTAPTATDFASLSASEMLRISFVATSELGAHRLQVRGLGYQPFAADFRIDDLGRCAGRIESNDVTVEVINTPDETFQKGDSAYWSQDSNDRSFIKAVAGRWARSPRIDGFANLCDFRSELGDLDTSEEPEPGELRVTGERTFEGTPAIEINAVASDYGGRMVIEAAEPHRLLAFFADGQAEFRLSAFDDPVRIDVPEQNEYVDLSQLAP